jgi:hypothetical protein
MDRVRILIASSLLSIQICYGGDFSSDSIGTAGGQFLSMGAGVAAGPGLDEVQIDPLKYLGTLQFDGKDYLDTGEQNFPQPFVFNTIQDANGDGRIDTDDALENLVPLYVILILV